MKHKAVRMIHPKRHLEAKATGGGAKQRCGSEGRKCDIVLPESDVGPCRWVPGKPNTIDLKMVLSWVGGGVASRSVSHVNGVPSAGYKGRT